MAAQIHLVAEVRRPKEPNFGMKNGKERSNDQSISKFTTCTKYQQPSMRAPIHMAAPMTDESIGFFQETIFDGESVDANAASDRRVFTYIDTAPFPATMK